MGLFESSWLLIITLSLLYLFLLLFWLFYYFWLCNLLGRLWSFARKTNLTYQISFWHHHPRSSPFDITLKMFTFCWEAVTTVKWLFGTQEKALVLSRHLLWSSLTVIQLMLLNICRQRLVWFHLAYDFTSFLTQNTIIYFRATSKNCKNCKSLNESCVCDY